jgi:hypothetical protein
MPGCALQADGRVAAVDATNLKLLLNLPASSAIVVAWGRLSAFAVFIISPRDHLF